LQYKHGSHAENNVKKPTFAILDPKHFLGDHFIGSVIFLPNLQTFLCFFVVADDLKDIADGLEGYTFRLVVLSLESATASEILSYE
jgi:hypothetical protein